MPAPSLCVVSGVVYDENGVPAVGVTLYLKRVILNGVLIGTAPIGSATIPGPSGDHNVFYIEAITSIAGGVVSFTVPQLSTIYMEGNVSGFNNGETAFSIPATATATLESLVPATFPIDVTTFTFLSLVDTPDDFTGDALKIVRVNAAGTALEFSAPVVVDNETVQDALSAFFPDVAPFDWTYDDAGDRVTLTILDATAAARGLMSIAYAARLDQLEVGDAPTFAGLTLNGGVGKFSVGAVAQWMNLDTDASNYERGFAKWNTNVFEIGTESLGAGVGRSLRLVSRGVAVMDWDSASNLTIPATIITTGGSIVGRSSMMAFEGNTSISLANTCPLNWSSTGAYNGTKDVGLARRAAGVLRTSNGSTGSGQLLIGSSTDTIAAQLHTLSNAIGVIPFIAEGPAGQTANLFEARVNGVTKLYVDKDGGAKIGIGATANDGMLIGGTTAKAISVTSNALGAHYQLIGDTSGGGGPSELRFGSGALITWRSTTRADAGANDLSLTRNAANILQVGDGAANANGKVRAAEYQVAAIKVIGAQGAAVADATDNPSAITQLNALLARLRAHGLIAT